MDSFFDFNQSTTQSTPATASTATPRTASQDWNSVSPFDKHEERQHFNGPSHDYNLHKQQVGLPVGSMPQSMFDGWNSGMGDMSFGYSSGIDFDTDMNMDFNNPQSAMPAMFFPPQTSSSQTDNYVDPATIGGPEEPTSNVGRLWPGMHSQQAQHAAMQKAAQVQAVQQRQMKLQAQHAQYRQAGNNSQSQPSSQQSAGHSKRPSHVTEPHVEESISRLLNQMRQNSTVSVDDDEDDSGNMLPHIARMKKDAEEMDEDELLLASEEGKKLSSKERRQLRNKVSARAFRSRRKGKSITASSTDDPVLITFRIHLATRRRTRHEESREHQPSQRQLRSHARERPLSQPDRNASSSPVIHTLHQRHQQGPVGTQRTIYATATVSSIIDYANSAAFAASTTVEHTTSTAATT